MKIFFYTLLFKLLWPENSLNYPLRIHGTSSTYPPPLEIGPENSINYPPSNSRNLIDYPPSKSGRKTPSTTPLEFTAGTEIRPPKFNS